MFYRSVGNETLRSSARCPDWLAAERHGLPGWRGHDLQGFQSGSSSGSRTAATNGRPRSRDPRTGSRMSASRCSESATPLHRAGSVARGNKTSKKAPPGERSKTRVAASRRDGGNRRTRCAIAATSANRASAGTVVWAPACCKRRWSSVSWKRRSSALSHHVPACTFANVCRRSGMNAVRSSSGAPCTDAHATKATGSPVGVTPSAPLHSLNGGWPALGGLARDRGRAVAVRSANFLMRGATMAISRRKALSAPAPASAGGCSTPERSRTPQNLPSGTGCSSAKRRCVALLENTFSTSQAGPPAGPRRSTSRRSDGDASASAYRG